MTSLQARHADVLFEIGDGCPQLPPPCPQSFVIYRTSAHEEDLHESTGILSRPVTIVFANEGGGGGGVQDELSAHWPNFYR